MRALIAFLLMLVVLVMAQGTGSAVLFQLFYIMAGLLMLSYLWARLSLYGVRAWRELRTNRAQVGGRLEERLVVENRSIWPKLWVEVSDPADLPEHRAHFVTDLPPRQRRRLWVRTTCQLRGKYTLGPIVLRSGDPLGLFQVRQQVADRCEVVIYPATEEVYGFHLPLAELPGGTATRRRTHHITPNVSGVRDYVPGDSLNRIHWPSTVRHRRLIVKEFELDPTAEVWIVLDMERAVQRIVGWRGPPPAFGQEVRSPESTEEYAVTAAASLARHLILQQRRSTGLIGWGQYREVLVPEREPRQFYWLLESLAILRAHGETPLEEVLAAESNRFGRNCSLVLITASTEPQWVQTSLRDLLYAGVRAVVVLVDGRSFGGWQGTQEVEVALQAQNVPYYLLRKGETVGAVLGGVSAALRTPLTDLSLRYRRG